MFPGRGSGGEGLLRVGKADIDERNSAAVPPMLAAASWSVHSQIHIFFCVGKNAVQLFTRAESECCFKCQKSWSARYLLQHLCRMKWPWLFCHENLTKLTHPIQWTVSSVRKRWRENLLFFSESVCTSWSKKDRSGQSSGSCSCQTEGTNLSISNAPVGIA